MLGAGVSWWYECVCVFQSGQCHKVLPPLINLPDEKEAVIIIKAVAAGLFRLFFSFSM